MSAFTLTQVASIFSTPSRFQDQSVEVGGWLSSARMGKRVGFLVLSDGSSQTFLQVVVPQALLEGQPSLRSLGPGCCVRVKGCIVASQGAGQAWELLADTIEVQGWVQDPLTYPIQAKEHSAEFLRSVPHLRHRTTQFAAVARLRHVLMRAVHDYLESHGFAWVTTPILTGTDAEGAGERLRATRLGRGEIGEDFFASDMFLTVSGQMEGEALSSGLSRVYTFGPTFRAEGSHTSRHLAEFWMVEPEMAFATLDDLQVLAQGLLQHCVRAALERAGGEMAYFAQHGGRTIAQWEQFADEDFLRVTYTDAIEQLQQSGCAFDVPVEWGMDLQSEHEKWLVEQAGRVLVVVDYPAQIKSFYMKASQDGCTVEAMDILVPGMGEIVGGSVREEDLDRLVRRMQDLGMDTQAYAQYLDLRRYGTVAHGGFGLGFERLVAYMASLSSIKDAIAYPRFAGG